MEKRGQRRIYKSTACPHLHDDRNTIQDTQARHRRLHLRPIHSLPSGYHQNGLANPDTQLGNSARQPRRHTTVARVTRDSTNVMTGNFPILLVGRWMRGNNWTGQVPMDIESRWSGRRHHRRRTGQGGSGKLERVCVWCVVCGCRRVLWETDSRRETRGGSELGRQLEMEEAGPRHPCCPPPVSHPANHRGGWRCPLAAARDGWLSGEAGGEEEGNKRGLWNGTSSFSWQRGQLKSTSVPLLFCSSPPRPCPVSSSKLTTNPPLNKQKQTTTPSPKQTPESSLTMKSTTLLPLFALGALSQNFSGQPACAVRPPSPSPSPTPPKLTPVSPDPVPRLGHLRRRLRPVRRRLPMRPHASRHRRRRRLVPPGRLHQPA